MKEEMRTSLKGAANAHKSVCRSTMDKGTANDDNKHSLVVCEQVHKHRNRTRNRLGRTQGSG